MILKSIVLHVWNTCQSSIFVKCLHKNTYKFLSRQLRWKGKEDKLVYLSIPLFSCFGRGAVRSRRIRKGSYKKNFFYWIHSSIFIVSWWLEVHPYLNQLHAWHLALHARVISLYSHRLQLNIFHINTSPSSYAQASEGGSPFEFTQPIHIRSFYTQNERTHYVLRF